MQLTVAVRNALLSAISDQVTAGSTLKVYPGSSPGLDNAPGTALATLTNVICGTPSNGVLPISADTDNSATGSGTPGFLRLATSGETVIADLSSGVGTGECSFTGAISQNSTVSLSNGSIIEGNLVLSLLSSGAIAASLGNAGFGSTVFFSRTAAFETTLGNATCTVVGKFATVVLFSRTLGNATLVSNLSCQAKGPFAAILGNATLASVGAYVPHASQAVFTRILGNATLTSVGAMTAVPSHGAILKTLGGATLVCIGNHVGSGILPIPQKALWESNMVQFGTLISNPLIANQNDASQFDYYLNEVYYDGIRVYHLIYSYTGNAFWVNAINAAINVYRDKFVIRDNGQEPAFEAFTHGLVLDYQRRGDVLSKNAVFMLSDNAGYAADSTPLEWTSGIERSREVAYNIMSQLNSEVLGRSHRTRTDDLVNQALAHLDSWTVSLTAHYTRPFMVSLTCDALTMQYEMKGDSRVIPAIRTALDWLWTNMWDPAFGGFKYTNVDTSTFPPDDEAYNSGGTEPTADLNLLICPIYAWIYYHTGVVQYRDRGDAIFVGGVTGAYLYGGKQFDQNYKLSFKFVQLRELPPLV